ncbi:MAG: nucleotidyltransferase family protein [Clostridia bacterium]|nr:nucleotidyltransferase family protein [Clostridia bacterium]
MTHTEYEFAALLGNVVFGKPLPQDFAVEDLRKLALLALRHDMGHIIYKGLDIHGLIADKNDTGIQKLYNHYMMAIYRVTVLENEFRRVKEVLKKHNIDFLPLKGSVLRGSYREPWMRVSADIDILVKSSEIADSVCKLLVKELEYELLHGEADYDCAVLAPSGFHVEVHFALGSRGSKPMGILSTVWEKHVVRVGDDGCEFKADADFFYFYHVYHASRHFLNGGCGVKALLDEAVLAMPFEVSPGLRGMLDEAGLSTFRDTLSEITSRWFGASDSPLAFDRPDDLAEKTGLYILEGGMFGGGHYIKAQVARKSNRFTYFVRRLFPPATSMVPNYPSLKKTKLTLPFCWIHRIAVKGIGKGKIKESLDDDIVKRVNDGETVNEIRELFKELEMV